MESKNRSIISCGVMAVKVGSLDRAKNQPICHDVGRFLAICFGPDIDEMIECIASLFFVTTPDLHHRHSPGHPDGAGRCGKIGHDLSAYCGSTNRFG
jgi:hypothetical protein